MQAFLIAYAHIYMYIQMNVTSPLRICAQSSKFLDCNLLLYIMHNTLYQYPYWLHITCLCRFAAQCILPPLWCWDYKRDHIYWLVEKRDRRHWSWSGLTVSKRFLWLVGKCWPWIRQWKWNLKSIILKAPNIVKVYIKIYYRFASGKVVCIKSFAIIIIII